MDFRSPTLFTRFQWDGQLDDICTLGTSSSVSSYTFLLRTIDRDRLMRYSLNISNPVVVIFQQDDKAGSSFPDYVTTLPLEVSVSGIIFHL